LHKGFFDTLHNSIRKILRQVEPPYETDSALNTANYYGTSYISTMLHHSPFKKANGDIIIESSATKILLPDDGYCKKIKIANK